MSLKKTQSLKKARSKPGNAAAPSTFYVMTLTTLSAFLLGTFLLGNLTLREQFVAEIRLATVADCEALRMATNATGGEIDLVAIAESLAGRFRPDATVDSHSDEAHQHAEGIHPHDEPHAGASHQADLALLREAEISLDRSEGQGPIVRITWANPRATQRASGDANNQAAAHFLAAAQLAEAISEEARHQATTNHHRTSQLLDETTAAIRQIEESINDLLRREQQDTSSVLPVSYQSPSGMGGQGPALPAPGRMSDSFSAQFSAAESPEALRDLLIRLRNEQSEMSLTMTVRHPDLVEKARQIAAVEARLEAMPLTQMTTQSPEPRFRDVAADIGGNETDPTRQLRELESKLESMAASRRLLLDEWQTRMQMLAGLKHDRDSLLQSQRQSVTAALELADVQLAHVENVHPGKELIPARWGLLAGSLLLGGVVVSGGLVRWGRRSFATFATADEIESTIGVPVVRLNTGAETTNAALSPGRRAFRRTIFVLEMFLAVTVIWIVMLAIADIEYRRMLSDNPLLALLETCGRSWRLLLG